MAAYNADINVNVNVFDNKLRDLERRIKALDKIANPKKPLTKDQAAEEIRKLKEELSLNKRAKALLDQKQQAEEKLKKEYRDQLKLRKEELSYEERLLRLSNAKRLQEARLTSLERAGAFEGKGRATEIRKLTRKAAQFPENPVIQERIATALGRILTLQNSINRADIKNIGQKQRIDDYNKRIEALRRVGVSEGKLRDVLRRRAEFTTAADRRQDVIADKRERQLKRQLQLLERKNALQLKAFRTTARVESSPLSRAPKRTVLDTPEAAAKKAAYYDKIGRSVKAASSALPPRSVLGSDEAIRQKYEYYQKIGRTIKAASSALPPRSVLGSDEAIRQKYEYYQRIGKAIKAPSSPVSGTTTMVGSPKYLASLKTLGLELRKFARSFNDIVSKANEVSRKKPILALPSSKDLNARARGIKRLQDKTTASYDLQFRQLKRRRANEEELASFNARTQRLGENLVAKRRREEEKLNRTLKQRQRIIDKNTKSEQKSANKLTEKRKASRGRFLQNAASGVGFPLLFGGGPGSIIGGLVGAIGGFGGSILGSAIGQQIDNLGISALVTAKSFGKLGATVEDLLPTLGRGGGGGFTGQAQFLAARGRESEVAVIARQRFDEVYGPGATERYEELAKTAKEFDQVLNEVGIGFKNLAAGPLKAILDALKGISPAGGQTEAQFSQQNRERANRISTLLTRQKEEGGLSISEKTELDRLQKEIFTRGQEPLTETTNAQDKLQKLYNDELKQTKELLDQETSLVESQLSARRDTYATQQGQLAIAKSTFEIDKLTKQLRAEEKQDSQDILRIAELKESIVEKEAQRERERARKKQAEIQAERAIQRDIRAELINQAGIAKTLVDIANRSNNLTQKEDTIYESTMKNLDNIEKIETEILALQLEGALVGVNEANVQDQIKNTFQGKVNLLRESIRLQREEAKITEIARRDAELARKQNIASIFTEGRRAQQQQIRESDPSRAFSFASQGLGFFGESGLFEANRLAESAAQIEKYNEQIANLTTRYVEVKDAGAIVDLQDARRLDSLFKEIQALEAEREAYEKLQPAIDKAAIFQARYNDALAAVSPGINSLVSGLSEVIAGTKSVEEAFADFLKTIADQLLQTAATMIAQYIALGIAKAFAFGSSPQTPSFSEGLGTGLPLFGDYTGLSGKANGGPVNANQPYIVGERGPGLFVPFQQGSITSNEALQQAATTQVPFTRNAESVTQAQETAQAMRAAGPIEVRYESNVINGVEYVTAEQHRKGMAQAAERGRSLTIQALQNSVKTRGRVGL